jgi:CRP/FNR family transcriptional regulator
MDAENQVIDIARLRRGCASCSLQQLCLPAGIGITDLDRLDDLVRRRRPLTRGDFLFRAGAPLASLYVARDGAFKTMALSEEGDLQVIGFHLPGELIGLDALGTGIHRCDAVALAPASVCEVPFNELGLIAAQVPGLQRQLLRVMGQRMDRNQKHVEMMGRRHASERLAMFLHSLSERFRELGKSADEFSLPMSREDIASYLGMVIETVSRTFSKFQDDGIISVRGRQLRILDHKRLSQMVHEPEERRARS